jgi:hypothetical protein
MVPPGGKLIHALDCVTFQPQSFAPCCVYWHRQLSEVHPRQTSEDCLKCIQDKLQKVVYVFEHVGSVEDNHNIDTRLLKDGEGMNPKVCESIFRSPLEIIWMTS